MGIKGIGILIILLLATGCSAFMAGQRSTYRGDPGVIQPGADRTAVESTLGAPDMMVSLDDGRAKAVYKIDPDAHTKVGRNAAVAWHAVADVFTLGLWEVVGTPLEMAAKDKFVTYIVYYGKDWKIERVETLK